VCPIGDVAPDLRVKFGKSRAISRCCQVSYDGISNVRSVTRLDAIDRPLFPLYPPLPWLSAELLRVAIPKACCILREPARHLSALSKSINACLDGSITNMAHHKALSVSRDDLGSLVAMALQTDRNPETLEMEAAAPNHYAASACWKTRLSSRREEIEGRSRRLSTKESSVPTLVWLQLSYGFLVSSSSK